MKIYIKKYKFNNFKEKKQLILINIPLTFKSNMIDIKSGKDHSIFLSEDGRIYGYGKNYDGQLGLGENYKNI